jgi:predicted Rossmann-fold nucleotide-binding protein
MLSTALRELRYAFKVFAPFRHRRKVTVFGSARLAETHPAYRQAHEFARRLADDGYMVITGAGGGIMRACNEGSGRERSFGINIRLPFEQAPNDFIHRDPKVNFKYFFTRKLIFVKRRTRSRLFPGGFGTHDEGFGIAHLLQTGKDDSASGRVHRRAGRDLLADVATLRRGAPSRKA